MRGHYAKRKGKRVRVRGHLSHEEAPRRRRRKGRRRSYGRRRRRGAMENPLSGMELAVGALTGLVGYTAADVLDRYIASRPTAKLVIGAQMPSSTEVPPYLDLYRVGAGVAIAAVPLIAAQFISSGTTRSALQFFGFGAAFNILGKAVTGGLAYLLKDNDYGRRLFPQTIAAAQLQGMAGIPSSGVGMSGLPLWVEGLGACCRGGASLDQHKLQPPGGGMPPSRAGQVQPPAGYPPMSTPPQTVTFPNPPVFAPPGGGGGGEQPPPPPVVTRQPQTPASPPTIALPPGTTITAQPPTVVGGPPAGATAGAPASPLSAPPFAALTSPLLTGLPSTLRGLGAAQRAALQPALEALSTHRDAFDAIRSGSANQEQHDRAQRIVTHFAPQFRQLQTLAALPAEQPKRVNPYRWGQHKTDDAAE